eukprot:gene23724-16918_t
MERAPLIPALRVSTAKPMTTTQVGGAAAAPDTMRT